MVQASNKTEEVDVVFERVVWTSPEGNFIIGRTRCGLTVKGSCEPSDFQRGGLYRLWGTRAHHEEYGDQFNFVAYSEPTPVQRGDVIAYLSRHLKKCGIGGVRVHQLVDLIGPQDVLAVMKNEPQRVADMVPGISIENAREAASQLREIEAFQDTRVELSGLFEGAGFSKDTIQTCLKLWRGQAAKRIRRDPFILLTKKVPSCGFFRVDALYIRLGLPPDRLKRQTICLWHAIGEAGGDTWVPLRTCREKLNQRITGVPQFERAAELGVRAKWIERRDVRDGTRLSRFDWADEERDSMFQSLRFLELPDAEACKPHQQTEEPCCA